MTGVDLYRKPALGDATIGRLALGGVFQCWTLEGLELVPAGEYRLLLTPSYRASTGALWSPRADHVLPLIDGVPGRDGIRLHAGNNTRDTSGCVIVGQVSAGPELLRSRIALVALLDVLEAVAGGLSITIHPAVLTNPFGRPAAVPV